MEVFKPIVSILLLVILTVVHATAGAVISPSGGVLPLPKPPQDPFVHRQPKTGSKELPSDTVHILKPQPKAAEERLEPRCSNPLGVTQLVPEETRTFKSPGYPWRYPRDTLCGWSFLAPVGFSIVLSCRVTLKPDDFLHIYDYSTEILESVDNIQDGNITRSYVGDAIAVLLETNRRRQAAGFQCDIWLSTAPTTTDAATTSTGVFSSETPSVAPVTPPTTQPPTVPTTQPPTVPTTQPPTVPTTQPPTVLTTQPPTAPTTQPPTVPTTQPPTVPTTQPPTVPTTQPPTVPTTQPPTVPTTQPPTVPTTQPPTVPTTQPPVASRCQCGIKQASRIVGGQTASVDEYPWMVSLGVGYQGQFCGGTLISDSWIVTAAHCISEDLPQNPGSLDVGLGFHSLSTPTEASITRTARAVIPHPDYNENTFENDIALIRVDPVDWEQNPAIRPACLPDNAADLYIGSPGVVTGWGALSSGGSYPDKLMEVTIPIISNAECEGYLISPIPDVMVCAGVPQGGIDSCQGDSGGPMVVMDGSNAELVGVVSWGYGCAEPASPGVYARVTEFLPWIESITSESEFCPRV